MLKLTTKSGTEVVAHYGSFTVESEKFAEGQGIVDLSFCRVFSLKGADRYSWLNKVTSQVFPVHNGDDYSKEALLLDPQGRVVAALCAVVKSEEILIVEQAQIPQLFSTSEQRVSAQGENYTDHDTSSDEGALINPMAGFFSKDLPELLQSLIFMADVTIAEITHEVTVFAVAGKTSVADVLSRADFQQNYDLLGVWTDPWRYIGVKNATYCNVEKMKSALEELKKNLSLSPQNSSTSKGADNSLEDIRFETDSYGKYAIDEQHPSSDHHLSIVIAKKKGATNQELEVGGYTACGIYAFESYRISAYRPWGCVDNKLLPHEVDWLRSAVQLEKGCYCGQETVARVVNVGKPARRLVKLYIDGYADIFPQKDNLIFAEQDLGDSPEGAVSEAAKAVGKVIAVAMHHDEGLIGLGLLKRNTSPDSLLSIQVPVDAENAEGKTEVSVRVNAEQIVSPLGRCTASPDMTAIQNIRRNKLI